MNPFFFGSSKSPLYGVYHPPRAGAGPARAVLLCYPMGAEYMRAHRAFRQLTNLLVKGGTHVLRFDYFGTGDSAGDGTEATVPRWLEDVGTAIDELKESAQVSLVTVIGLRFGGTLAALATAGRTDIERLVLWDPVIDGSAYVARMLATHEAEMAARGVPPTQPVAGVHGFPLTPELRRTIEGVDLLAWDGTGATRIHVVTSSEREEAKALIEALRRRGRDASGAVFESNGNWAESDAFGSALIPQSIIQGILSCVTEEGVRVT